MSFKRIFNLCFVTLTCITLLNCGSSNSSSTSTDTTTEESNATSVAQTTVSEAVSATPIATSGSGSNLLYVPVSFSCTGGGTFTYDIDSSTDTVTLSADNCITSFCSDSSDPCTATETTITTDGSFSGTLSGNTATFTYDEYSSITAEDGVVTTTFTMDGGMILDYDSSTGDTTVTFSEFSGTDGDTADTYSADGTFTYNASTGLINGEITITQTNTITCTFTDFAYATATSSDWDSACEVS